MAAVEFDVRGEIMAAISKTDDAERRAMLMLMLGVLERVERWFNDDEALRQKVLNGLTIRHKQDHEWIEKGRQMDCHAVCEWAKGKMDDEEAAKEVATHRVRKVIDKLAEHAVTVLITGLAIYFGFLK